MSKCGFNEVTSVKINKEKKDLAKSKGLKLQDLLNHALDEALGLNSYKLTNLRLSEIENEIAALKIEKEKAMADCKKKIDILMKGLNESMERESENFDKEIQSLELEREYIKNLLSDNDD